MNSNTKLVWELMRGVAKEENLSSVAIQNYCRRFGVKLPAAPQETHMKEAVELVRDGVPLAKVARQFKLPESTLRSNCSKAAIELRQIELIRRGDECLEMIRNGVSVAEVARKIKNALITIPMSTDKDESAPSDSKPKKKTRKPGRTRRPKT